jgi:PilZ domain
MTDEKRVAARVRPHPSEPVEIQLMSKGFLDIFEARDISTTGAGIFVPYRFEGCALQNAVELVITLPNGDPFLAKGRIIHRTKTEREFFGVEFVDLPQERILEIAHYVERRLAEDARREPADPPIR